MSSEHRIEFNRDSIDLYLKEVAKAYRKIVGFCLDHKIIVLLVSVILLFGTGFLCFARGFSFMPDMAGTQLSVNVTMPDEADFKTACGTTDKILERLDSIDDIDTVGAVVGSNVLSSISIGGGGSDTGVSLYVILKDEKSLSKPIEEICSDITEKCADLDCEMSVDSSGMGGMTSMLTGSGMSINVFCDNFDTLQEYSKLIAQAVEKTEGTENRCRRKTD